jgi:hypothetical protein
MKQMLFYVIAALAILLPVYLWYWTIFRRVVIARLRYRLFALRDTLRLQAVDTELSPEDRAAYPLVETACNRALRSVDSLTFADVIMFKPDKHIELAVQRDMEIIEAASKLVRDIRSNTLEAAFAAMLVNSPGVLCLMVPFSVLIVCYYWFNRAKTLGQKYRDRLWEILSSDSGRTNLAAS